MCLLLAAQGALAAPATTLDTQWFEARGERFTVLADSPAGAEIAAELERFRGALEQLSPQLRWQETAPFEIVAISQRDRWDQLTVGHQVSHRASGMHLRRNDASWLLLDLSGDPHQALRTARHELVHHLMALNLPSLPVALAEGFAEYYAETTVVATAVTLGQSIPAWTRLVSTEGFDVAELLALTTSDEAYTDARHASRLYARGWALAHWLLEGDAPDDAATMLLAGLARGLTPERALSQATGLLGRDVAERVRLHVAGIDARASIPQRLENTTSPPSISALPRSESLRRLAPLALVLGDSSLALSLAQSAWIAATQTPDAMAQLAEVLDASARHAEAETLWIQAVDSGLRDPRLLVLRGNQLLAQGQGSLAIHLGETAERIQPNFVAALTLVARAQLAAAEHGPATHALVRRARELRPFSPDLVVLEAVVLASSARAAQARVMIDSELAALAPELVERAHRAVQREVSIDEARRLLSAGRVSAALEAWDVAIDLTEDPSTRANMEENRERLSARHAPPAGVE